MSLTQDEIRAAAESDLEVFIELVAPHLHLGNIHRELIRWWMSSKRRESTLVLLPRGHLKSKLLAYKAAWELTKDPTETIIYVSATSDLAEKQLFLIKQILTSKIYRKYWPEMVNKEEGKRQRWNNSEIIVDHPLRIAEVDGDPSIKAAGLTTNITGFHATNVKLDDIVVPNNAYTETGRDQVSSQISQIASIQEPDAVTDCVGTRYHMKDQYDTFLGQIYYIFEDDEDGNEVISQELNIWDLFIRVVEDDGEFLWPRSKRKDGKAFGFDRNVLSKIKAKYTDRTQFYAQYYNDPNDPESMRVDRSKFQYYDRDKIENIAGNWFYGNKRLNVFAGIDFAYTMNKRADWSSVVVIGMDSDNDIYVLDIFRFKTDRISEYYKNILAAYSKWGFKKLRAEISAAQVVIVKDLKENYIKPNGLNIKVDEYRPGRSEGSKEERMRSTLEPRYDNLQIYHYNGGFIQELEEEIMMERPPHDDIKDCLASVIGIAIAPKKHSNVERTKTLVKYHGRFGGVAI